MPLYQLQVQPDFSEAIQLCIMSAMLSKLDDAKPNTFSLQTDIVRKPIQAESCILNVDLFEVENIEAILIRSIA